VLGPWEKGRKKKPGGGKGRIKADAENHQNSGIKWGLLGGRKNTLYMKRERSGEVHRGGEDELEKRGNVGVSFCYGTKH